MPFPYGNEPKSFVEKCQYKSSLPIPKILNKRMMLFKQIFIGIMFNLQLKHLNYIVFTLFVTLQRDCMRAMKS